jgi:hypothetical protein
MPSSTTFEEWSIEGIFCHAQMAAKTNRYDVALPFTSQIPCGIVPLST